MVFLYFVFLIIPWDCEHSGEKSLQMINIDLKRISVRSVIHQHVNILEENVSQQPRIISIIRGQEIISPEVNLFVNICKTICSF